MPILNGFPQGGGDGKFLPLTGGTMSGSIAMGSNKLTGLANGTSTGDAVNLGQLNGKLSTSGGTMSGALNMGSKKITNLAAGTSSTDAANLGQLKDAGKFKSIFVTNGNTGSSESSVYFTPVGIMVCKYGGKFNISVENAINIKQMMLDAYPWFSSITSLKYRVFFSATLASVNLLTTGYAEANVWSKTTDIMTIEINVYNAGQINPNFQVPYFLPLMRINY